MPLNWSDRLRTRTQDIHNAISVTYNLATAEDYGIVPDTGADMTTTIQAALNTFPLGQTLVIPPGTYVVSADITHTRSFNISAYGAVFHYGNNFLYGFVFGTGTGTTGVRSCYVEGLTVKRTYTFTLTSAGAGTGLIGTGFKAYGLGRCTVRDVQVEGWQYGFLLRGVNGNANISGCSENVFIGCRALNCRNSYVLEQEGADSYVNENDFYSCEHQHSTSFSTTELTSASYGIAAVRILWGGSVNPPNNNRFWGCNFEAPAGKPMYRKAIVEGSDNGFYHCRWEGNNAVARVSAVTAIANPGSGYSVGDLITLAGGTTTSAAVLRVSSVSGGQVTGATIYSSGSYQVAPSNPVAQASVAPVGGTGATFTLAFTNGCDITIGRGGSTSSNMTRNMFHHGSQLNTIADSKLVEFISTSGHINNGNQFITGWSSVWSGGAGTNSEPAITFQGGSNDWEAVTFRAVSGSVADFGRAHRTMHFSAQDPNGKNGMIGFWDKTLTSSPQSWISMDTTSPWDIIFSSGISVAGAGRLYANGSDLNVAPSLSGGRIMFANSGATDTPSLAARNGSSSKTSFALYTSTDDKRLGFIASPSAPSGSIGGFKWFSGTTPSETERNCLFMSNGSPWNLLVTGGFGWVRGDAAGTQYIAFKAPSTVASSITFTLPGTDGTSGQALTTNGSTTLSWATPQAFPVGSIYLAVVSTNPATLLGYGTWTSIGAGRVLVGLDSGDVDFDTVEETGGAKTVASAGTISGSVANESAHTHSVTSNVTVANHTLGTVEAFASSSANAVTTNTHSVTNNAVTSGAGSAHTHTAGTLAYTGSPTSVVQPYFVCYMWKRTA